MSIEGFISYPGILEPQFITSAVRTNGLRPDRALLFAKPQNTAPLLMGDLVFGFDSTTIRWKDSLCDMAYAKVSRDGQYVIYTILDGRWGLAKNFVVGAYNIRLPDGDVDTDTRKTLRELVELLFEKMGATVDASDVSSEELPEVVFDHDRVIDELEELLYPRGYVISYRLDHTFKIFRIGSGATLPNDDDVVSFANAINPPELPETLRACGARTRVQSKLHMVPVGLDNDGKVKKVDKLSYNPSGEGVENGWVGKDFESFNYITDQNDQVLAMMSVGKWYQVEFQANDDHLISDGTVDYAPGEIAIDSALQYLPLSDRLVTSSKDEFGMLRRDEAYAEGEIYDDDDNPPRGKNRDKFLRLGRRFWTLDKENGILKFRVPARRINDDNKWTFADIYFVCSYSVHDNETHVKDRFIRDRDLGGHGTDQIKVEELERTLECQYASDNVTIERIIDNESDVNEDADLLLDNVQASYATTLGNTILYRGIRAYTTDGINLQVVWTVPSQHSETPFSTFVSQGLEAHPLCPTSLDRRRRRQNDRTNQWNTGRGRRYRNSKKRKEED